LENVGKTAKLMGTALMAALVIVFDYSLKYSGLKIPFPWLPFLKFDFTGVPIAVSTLLYGVSSGAFTSAVAFLAIFARGSDYVGASMKAIAEFTTIAGFWASGYFPERYRKGGSIFLGLLFRIVTMSLLNLWVMPNVWYIPYEATVGMLPMIGVFNGMQGGISLLFGYAIYAAYKRRMG